MENTQLNTREVFFFSYNFRVEVHGVFRWNKSLCQLYIIQPRLQLTPTTVTNVVGSSVISTSIWPHSTWGLGVQTTRISTSGTLLSVYHFKCTLLIPSLTSILRSWFVMISNGFLGSLRYFTVLFYKDF